ncbi:hypothetical protein IQ62_23155 [Streptomyces scabiei]|nr:hypothetical protein IQ62_23155 [Streptomyces scabiei]
MWSPVRFRAGSGWLRRGPKATNSDGGKGLDSISVSDSDPNPVSLKVGTITVDKRIVTTCHTSAQDTVPGDGTDGALLFNRLVDKLESQL